MHPRFPTFFFWTLIATLVVMLCNLALHVRRKDWKAVALDAFGVAGIAGLSALCFFH